MGQFFNALTITAYRISIPAPFYKKDGFHISWENEKKIRLISDVSPLPGYSKESIGDVYTQLLQIKNQGSILNLDLLPSVDFAINHPLRPKEKIRPQRYQALIQKKTFNCDLTRLHLFKTLKIKTKNFTDQEIIDFIKAYTTSHAIRLDAQRVEFSTKLQNFLTENESFYEYIEEPHVRNIQGLKIALDETLYLEKTYHYAANIVALVYKPTLCGSVKAMESIFHKYHDRKIILSSSYESTLGMSMLMKLHQSLNKEDTDIGLDTFPIDETTPYLLQTPPLLTVK